MKNSVIYLGVFILIIAVGAVMFSLPNKPESKPPTTRIDSMRKAANILNQKADSLENIPDSNKKSWVKSK